MKKKRAIFKYCIKLSLTIMALALLLRIVGGRKIINALLDTDLLWLLPMYVVMLGRRLIEAFQMHTLLRFVKLEVSASRVFFANALSSMYGFILPGDLIAAGAKWANISAATGRKSMTLNAIIYNRLALILPVLLIGCTALIINDPFQNNIIRGIILCFTLFILLFAVFLYHPKLGPLSDKYLYVVAYLFPEFVSSRIDMMIKSLQPYRALKPSNHGIILCLSVMSTCFKIIVFILGIHAVGIKVSLLSIVWIMAFLSVSRFMPITINNIGVREGLLIVLLGLYNVPAETATAFGLVIFSRQILVAFIGLGYQIALTNGWAHWRTADS